MNFSSIWNQRQRNRVLNNRAARRGRQIVASVESMEPRQMLSASALFLQATGELSIELNSIDSVRITSINGIVSVQVSNNGAAFLPVNSIGNVPASSVISINVLGSDQPNVIDLSGVTAADFTSLTSIRVDGANGDDLLIGSPDLEDSLIGGNGRDTIQGQGGNDTLVGGDGADLIVAGTGDDSISAGDGDDVVQGEDGNDTISGGNGQDTVSGGNGNDSINGANGQDSLSGDAGVDTINGDGGTDTIDGGDDNDLIFGGEFDDSLGGGAGNDTIQGQGGNDNIDGQAGDDSLVGGAGNDNLQGSDGNDVLNGQSGNDVAGGGTGNDTIVGGAGNDLIDGGQGNDVAQGQSGNDTLLSGGGSDLLNGGAGDDLIDTRVAQIAIDNVQLVEGDAETSQLTFTVSLSSAVFNTVTVDFATSSDGTITGGTATAGADYTAASGTLTFLPGVVTQQISVTVISDTLVEADETFFVTLTNAVNAVIFDGSGEGRILNDEIAPVGGLQPTVFPGGGTVTAAGPHLFSTGTGDASVNLGVDGYGSFGSTNGPNGTNADYDPVGPIGPSGTTWGSALAIRVGNSGTREFLSSGTISPFPSGNLARPTITGTTTDAISAFSSNGLDFSLAQSVDPLNDNAGTRSGSLLTQTYTVTNPTAAQIDFELIRYLEGDLNFSGNFFQDGGGRLVTSAGDEIIFETDIAGTGATSTTFVGITGIGGTAPTTDRFELNTWTGLGTQILAGTSLGDLINGDGDGDQFVDAGNDADIGAALRNTFSLAAGSTVTYTTHTLFGTGAPSNIGTTPPPPPPPAPPPPLPVSLEPVTLLGGDGSDTLLAGDSNDLLNGGGGNDSLAGGGGNDSILGGSGDDTLDGQAGDDTLEGQGGNDSLIGGDGNDTFVLGNGAGGTDTADGGDGFNQIIVNGTGSADDFVLGQNAGRLAVTRGGTATIIASTNMSVQGLTINALGGDDTVTIQDLSAVNCAALVVINGGDGNDLITGQGAQIGPIRLTLNGDAGNDTIVGSEGSDSINGGSGNDAVNGRNGNDVITGADGSDTLAGGLGNDTINGGIGSDFLTGNEGDDSLIGADGNDTLRGMEGNDTLLGVAGDDVLNGMDGDDSILGGIGQDQISGGAGHDTLDGGRNNDTINGNSGDDRIRGDHGNDFINAGNGNNTISGGDGNDTIFSAEGNDLIAGNDGNDVVNSDGGDDTILGGDGADSIQAGSGNDIVLGGDGDDVLNGQGGTDTIAGNQGIDSIADPVSEIDENFVLSAIILAQLI